MNRFHDVKHRVENEEYAVEKAREEVDSSHAEVVVSILREPPVALLPFRVNYHLIEVSFLLSLIPYVNGSR